MGSMGGWHDDERALLLLSGGSSRDPVDLSTPPCSPAPRLPLSSPCPSRRSPTPPGFPSWDLGIDGDSEEEEEEEEEQQQPMAADVRWPPMCADSRHGRCAMAAMCK